jgi:glycosyltransferase involved in cell wall biosynthesis
MLTLSLVIPVFNEERHIKACLDSISTQTMQPFEVIVVDNNCTDRTIEIASQYENVKIIKETRQGRGWARSAGFTATSGRIIGRIDADCQLNKDWVERVLKNFEQDPELAGVTGLGYTEFFPYLPWPKTTLWSRAYYWYVHGSFRAVTMWGSCMALRKDVWHAVSAYVFNDDTAFHEDQDVSMLMVARGQKIIQDNKLRVSSSERSFHYLPKLILYWRLHKNTKIRHAAAIKSAKYHLPVSKTVFGSTISRLLALPAVVVYILIFPVDFIVKAFTELR